VAKHRHGRWKADPGSARTSGRTEHPTLRYESLAPYRHPERPWPHARVEHRERCWNTLITRVSGLDQARLLFAFGDAPEDLERRFRTTRHGSLRQGSLVREQTFAYRPHPDCSGTRTPVPGQYIGGGSVHPGVPGSLAGGYHAAAAVCADLGFERWWPTPEVVRRAEEEGNLPPSPG
jgi:phytoene dehydrogenase-like protein